MVSLNIEKDNSAKAGLFLKDLKQTTAGLHTLLESNALLSALLSPSLSVHQYYCYLFLMQKITVVYEQNIAGRLHNSFQQWTPRKSSPLLTADLQQVGYQPPSAYVTADFQLSANRQTDAFAAGIMYVMEGSKLGGKVIFRHIHRYLGFSATNGAAYLADEGADTFGRWKQFLHEFSTFIVQSNGEEQTIAGAKYAFSSIYNYLEFNRYLYGV